MAFLKKNDDLWVRLTMAEIDQGDKRKGTVHTIAGRHSPGPVSARASRTPGAAAVAFASSERGIDGIVQPCRLIRIMRAPTARQDDEAADDSVRHHVTLAQNSSAGLEAELLRFQ